MPWFWESRPAAESESQSKSQTPPPSRSHATTSSEREDEHPQRNAPQDVFLSSLATPQTVVSTILLTSAALFSIRFYKRHLRRIPTTFYLKASNFPAPTSNSTHTTSTLRPGPSLHGTITSINDPDNFRFYHTPGGRFLLWSTFLRPIPKSRQALKDQTLHIRIAGIDAPELGHFGKPAQPYGQESLDFMRRMLEGRRVRVYPLRRDQYERVVALAYISRGWLRGLRETWWEEWPYFWRKDVGLASIRAGMATVYEAKVGVEFGGEKRGERYRAAEKIAKQKRIGMWGGLGAGEEANAGIWTRMAEWLGWKRRRKPSFESPREYKDRMAKLSKEHENEEKARKMKGH